MRWPTVALRRIAPPSSAPLKFEPNAQVWSLSLDQIESDSGLISTKRYSAASEAGSSTFAFDTDNVLYSKLRPYLNKVTIPDEPGIGTTELIPLRPRKGVLDSRFLAYYLRSPGFVNKASHHVAGAKMPRVVMDWFWEHEVPLPALSEQFRIVEILDQGDRLRQLRRIADAKAERIIPAVFLRMFGDPATNPKGFRKQPLGELIRLRSGDFLPAKDMATAGSFPVYGGNGLSGHHDRYMFEDCKVVLGRVGAYCGVVHYSEPRAWITDNALYVSEKLQPLEDAFLVAALKQADLNQYAGRAGQPLISGSRVYPVEILVPPQELQTAFAERARSLNAVARTRTVATDSLDRFWSLLMGQAFSGRLTNKWRESRMRELLAEMEGQAKALDMNVSTGELS